MGINRNYKDKAEWQEGYNTGRVGIAKALSEAETKTKQGYYVASRMFNKKMADEHVHKNPKSDDFLAGMETAIQEEFQKWWESAPPERPSVFPVMGMPGVVGVHIPSVPKSANPKPEEKSAKKKSTDRFSDIDL